MARRTPLYIYIDSQGLSVERGDDLFGFVATSCGLPVVVGILFLLGVVASTYSSAGSALTALTTSFTLDIIAARRRYDETTTEGANSIDRVRKGVHSGIAVAMSLIIILFGMWSRS